MTNVLLEIRLLTPRDWELLRRTRLRALTDSPGAFAADPHLEGEWGEAWWRERLDAELWLAAFERDELIGIAAVVGGHADEGRHLEAVWVAPTHRRRGVLRRLVDTATEVCRILGEPRLLLWVLEDNIAARTAYTRLGFVDAGERQFLESAGRYERRFRRSVRRGR